MSRNPDGAKTLAPHVRAAIAAGAQPKMARMPRNPDGAKMLAPHVRAAIAAGAQPKMAGPADRRQVFRAHSPLMPRVLLLAAEEPNDPASMTEKYLASLTDEERAKFLASQEKWLEKYAQKAAKTKQKYLYHETFEDCMPGIKLYGLCGQIPKEGKNPKTGLPKADPSKVGFTSFAKTQSGVGAGGGAGKITLRLVVANAPDLLFQEFVGGEIKTAQPVPSAALEYLDSNTKEWIPISQWAS